MFATINLASGWSQVWGAISPVLGSSGTSLMTGIGVIIAVFSVVAWLWERRKGGGGQGHHKLLWSLLIGALLAGPAIVIPAALVIADFVVNGIIAIAGL